MRYQELTVYDSYPVKGDLKLFKSISELPYFFGYKTEFFTFQNNPKDLDPSCKMDLDLLDCLGKVKLVL